MYNALLVLVLISLLDIVTTYSALRRGATERNPIAKIIIDKIGFNALFILKYVGFLAVAVYAVLTNNEQVIWIANIINAVVVAWNSYINYKLSKR